MYNTAWLCLLEGPDGSIALQKKAYPRAGLKFKVGLEMTLNFRTLGKSLNCF